MKPATSPESTTEPNKNQEPSLEKVTKEVKPKDKCISKTPGSSVTLIVLAVLSMLLLIGSVVFLLLLPKKGSAVQKLRTQSLSFEISGQDELLLTQSLKETENERETLLSAFPTESSLLHFISIVDGLRSSPVEVLRFSVDSDVPTKIGKNPSFLPMTLKLRGEEVEVENALRKIVDSPYFIKTVTYTQEFDPNSNQVVVYTQFQLFVSDEFSKTNS